MAEGEPLDMTTGVDHAIRWLGEPMASSTVGGKAAYLSRLFRDFPIPPGFCVVGDTSETAVATAYQQMIKQTPDQQAAVAVRSSAIEEDGASLSFAGQHETKLNVVGLADLQSAITSCRDSLLSNRAMSYRSRHGIETDSETMPVLVQQFVAADVSIVAFSVNPLTGDPRELLINASWGVGEAIVGGEVTPDEFTVRRADRIVTSRQVGAKHRMTIAVPGGTEVVETPRFLRTQSALSDQQIGEVARLTLKLEKKLSEPVDIEATWSGRQLYLLQCRPVTALGERIDET